MSNALSNERSRYLKQHAENPVEWLPWGETAFEKARKEGRPLLISIGYSSCHWCHVMAHECYEDESAASVLNELYVPVKVDREEYPDVDGFYMEYLTQVTGSGGWPLNVLVNPHGVPFYGFTYLPKERFIDVMRRVHAEYRKQDDLERKKLGTTFELPDATEGDVQRALSGFRVPDLPSSSGPQFPQATFLLLALSAGKDEIVSEALSDLVTKGLYDHVEGGWFRYTVDPEWKVPHFEKMLYDQATLLLLCAHAHRLQPELTRYAIHGAVEWLQTHMRLPSGLYGSATDADTEEGEGVYYTIADTDRAHVRRLFQLDACGSHEGRKHPWLDLQWQEENPDAAQTLRKEYREARRERSAPGLDTKAVISWNALLGYALVRAGQALNDAHIRELGVSLHEALRPYVRPERAFHVVYEDRGFDGHEHLEDLAAYMLLCAELGDGEELDGLVEAVERRFVADQRLYHTNQRVYENLSLWQDSPVPSGGSLLLRALSKHDLEAARRMARRVGGLAGVAAEHPHFFSGWIRALCSIYECGASSGSG